MKILNLEKENFDELVSSGVVLVDFYADWCGPCKMLGPILEAFSSSRNDVRIIKVNVDQHEAIAQKFGIMSIPTLMLFKGGSMVSSKQGFHTIEMLNEWIDNEE